MHNLYEVYIDRGDEKEKIVILINGTTVATKPYNMVIEDAVSEMIEDIGKFDYKYLKELVQEDWSLHPMSI
jgi:metal-sulfur cluster biosynthetic enzyme